MNKYITLLVLATIWLNSCNRDENDLTPSDRTINWMEIQNEPGELNQLRYQIYKDYKLSVFVNDTLGVENLGIGLDGQPIIHYELLKVGYTIGVFSNPIKIILSSNTTAMIKALELFRDHVIPELPEANEFRAYSYLLCDTLYYAEASKPFYPIDVHQSMMVTEIGKLSDILDMDEFEQKEWCGQIIAKSIYSFLATNYETEIDEFLSVTLELGSSRLLYNRATTYWGEGIPDSRDNEIHVKGFREDQFRGMTVYDMLQAITPTMQGDVESYMAATYAYTENQFRERWGQYDRMMRKYIKMKEIMKLFKSNL